MKKKLDLRHLNSKECTPSSGFSKTAIDQLEKFLCMGILFWGKGGILAPDPDTPFQVNTAFYVLLNLLLSAPYLSSTWSGGMTDR